MFAFTLRRLLWLLPVLLTVAIVTFFLMHQAPGGPWDTGSKPISPSARRNIERKFGLDKPTWFNWDALRAKRAEGISNPVTLAGAGLDSQFFTYLSSAAQLDFGSSYRSQGADSVRGMIVATFPTSAKVGAVATLLANAVGMPLGVVAGLRPRGWVDRGIVVLSTLGLAVPTFVSGVLVVVILSRWFGIPPVRRPEEWHGFGRPYLVPGVVLGLGTTAFVVRLTRACLLDVVGQDFVRTARAKGLRERQVVGRHMLRAGVLPVLTLLGPAVVDLLTGSIIVETIFGVPGLGREFVAAIDGRDYPMIMGTTLFYALLIVLANLAVDLGYAALDPRLRESRRW